MILTSYMNDAVWKLLAGLLLGLLWGGLGVGLLAWALWQWLIGRSSALDICTHEKHLKPAPARSPAD